ncbi:ATP-dependent DNA helicase [Comamonas sp. CMM02]|uniref:ATP-dependent DNA helicase n=1 Tax=Comamonas sp. CMM02 TaxID=2769307 RepID=UPI001785ACEF|nr:ATP-dependent DNA helicase [Comamonas sp. CMM02]MBD9402668.1 ATP-dependent DNA helicase [Comamonas sp. CMM02]
MSLHDQVAAAFAQDGWLSRAEPHFRPRAGQTEMAMAVAQTIEDGGVLVVEAGTGVGKTFSYLVPALLSGQRVLVSTATKALQDQLYLRDLPRLVQALGLPLRVARLKGRSSYVCLHHLGQVHQSKVPLDPQVLRAVARVQDWSRGTRSGDLAELPGLAENSTVAALVTSTKDNCVGSSCAHWEQCHVNTARAQALQADVCVVNHHLFFADMEVRDSGVAQLLPTAGVVVIDEAHQLNETGIQFAGWVLGTRQLQSYIKDVLADVTLHARGLADWMQLLGQLEQALNEWRAVGAGIAPGSRLRWLGAAPEGVSDKAWRGGLHAVGQSLRALLLVLAKVAETAHALVALYERGARLLSQLASFAQPVPDDAVRWLEVTRHHLRLMESPLTIAHLMRAHMQPQEADDPASQPSKAWVFTSATLGDDEDLRWFTETCGLRQAQVLRVDSPFDYASQAVLYVPEDIPEPAQQVAHSAAVAQLAGDGAAALGGRTLVLTTTLKALGAIGHQLQQRFGLLEPMDVLVQGQGPKHVLMERFRAGTLHGRGCILVASSTFWEGVDIPGDALQLVVIDKLPFPPPDDPLVEARSRQMEMLGRSPFADYMLPEACMALKQGAGRLIRRETDQGILVVADARLRTKAYGKRLVAALPPMQRIGTQEAWQQALLQLVQGSAPVLSIPASTRNEDDTSKDLG